MSKKNVLRPVKMTYTAHSPEERPPSIIERLRTAISSAPENSEEPVKVRLINGWHDVTWEKINIVVCNFLYDRKTEHHKRWKELEQIVGIRREHLFCGACLVFIAAVLRQNPLVVMHSLAVLAFPAICTIVVLEDENMEGAKFWMKYWIVYGLTTSIGRAFKRSSTENHDITWLDVIFFTACLLSSTYLVDAIVAFIMPLVHNLRVKFEEYNYHHVS
uniref:Transmembrane protein n=1 Tax=Haemonchus contortus TaxID=6289 RepID=A0A7I4YF56_HAECO